MSTALPSLKRSKPRVIKCKVCKDTGVTNGERCYCESIRVRRPENRLSFVPRTGEKEVERAILEYLSSQVIMCWKNETAGVFDPTKKKFRNPSKFVRKGGADILGLVHKAFAIEVKDAEQYGYIMAHYNELWAYIGDDKKKNHYRRQIEFIEDYKSRGHIGFFTYSLIDCQEKLLRFGILHKNM